jgi:hypothetical protein
MSGCSEIEAGIPGMRIADRRPVRPDDKAATARFRPVDGRKHRAVVVTGWAVGVERRLEYFARESRR